MRVRLPKSRTLKTDLSIIVIATTFLYLNVENIFKYLLGNSFDAPFNEVGIYVIGAYILGFIIAYSILISVLVKLGRLIAFHIFGVQTGVDYVDVDL